jgi:divalent metal cation (Fe/Co/Zn/Cd) transporter
MSQLITTAVLVLKTLTLVLGGVITLYSYRAYRRTASRALRALAFGFGSVTLGAFLAGVVDQLIAVDPDLALVVESLFTTTGFAIILYSLYIE